MNRKTMILKRQSVLALLMVFSVASSLLITPQLSLAEPASNKYPNYTSLKGGYYYPTETLSLDNSAGLISTNIRESTEKLHLDINTGPYWDQN